MKRIPLFLTVEFFAAAGCRSEAPDLALNDLGYFERQGVNVLVFSNPFNGGFNDEKDSGIEVIHHGVLNLVAQAERIGHMAQTLSNSVLDNYHHLGDVAICFWLFQRLFC